MSDLLLPYSLTSLTGVNGFQPDKRTVWNRTGATLTIGALVMFDNYALNAAALPDDLGTSALTTVAPGDDTHWLSNVVNPATMGIGGVSTAGTPAFGAGAWFGVVTNLLSGRILPSTGVQTAPGVNDTQVEVTTQGLINVSLAASAVVFGSPLVAANGVRTLTVGSAAGLKILGLAQQASGGAAGNFLVLFDGIRGFGQLYAN